MVPESNHRLDSNKHDRRMTFSITLLCNNSRQGSSERNVGLTRNQQYFLFKPDSFMHFGTSRNGARAESAVLEVFQKAHFDKIGHFGVR